MKTLLNSELHIFHGLSGAAGQPFVNSRALREFGCQSDCVTYTNSGFNYSVDYQLPQKTDKFNTSVDFLRRNHNDYNVYHFYAKSFFNFNYGVGFPVGQDLMLLRAAGKAIIFNYRGSEIRLASDFKKLSPFNYVDENPGKIFSLLRENDCKTYMNFVNSIAHAVLVPDPELQSYVPQAIIVPRSIDLISWPYIGQVSKDDPLVVHAPSNEAIKGTAYVLKAIEELKSEGLKFRFELVKNVSNEIARERYKAADIVVDQLRIGWYGVLAAECMSLGKTVITYIRDDLVHHLPEPHPFIIANPLTFKDKLREAILNSQVRCEFGCNARAYVEKTHDATIVAKQLLEIYKNALLNPKPMDMNAALSFISNQRQLLRLNIKNAYNRLSRLTQWYISFARQVGYIKATRQALERFLNKA